MRLQKEDVTKFAGWSKYLHLWLGGASQVFDFFLSGRHCDEQNDEETEHEIMAAVFTLLVEDFYPEKALQTVAARNVAEYSL